MNTERQISAKQWQRRALKAEVELELMHSIRQHESEVEWKLARQLGAATVALREAQEAINWALEQQT